MTRVVTLICISYDNIFHDKVFHLIMVNRLHLIRIAINKNRRQLLVYFKTCVQAGANHWNRFGGNEFTYTENVNDF